MDPQFSAMIKRAAALMTSVALMIAFLIFCAASFEAFCVPGIR
jgi:hypothetical protein